MKYQIIFILIHIMFYIELFKHIDVKTLYDNTYKFATKLANTNNKKSFNYAIIGLVNSYNNISLSYFDHTILFNVKSLNSVKSKLTKIIECFRTKYANEHTSNIISCNINNTNVFVSGVITGTDMIKQDNYKSLIQYYTDVIYMSFCNELFKLKIEYETNYNLSCFDNIFNINIIKNNDIIDVNVIKDHISETNELIRILNLKSKINTISTNTFEKYCYKLLLNQYIKLYKLTPI